MNVATTIESLLSMLTGKGTAESSDSTPKNLDGFSNQGRGGAARTPFTHELGDIVDMSFFPKGAFTESQLALIGFYDGASKKIHRGESRNMGGVYEEHTKDMLQIYFDIEKQLKINPDYRFTSILIMHDYFEDHPKMVDLLKSFKRIMRELQERERPNGEIDEALESIRRERYALIADFSALQDSFIDAYCHQQGVTGQEKASLHQDCRFVLGVVEWLTRNTEQRHFHDSVFLLHKMHNLEEYSNERKGSPSRSLLIRDWDSKKPIEPLDYYLARVLGKVIDRIALSRERKHRFTEEQATELETLLQQNPLLRETYGEIDFRGADMPRPYKLNLLYRNFVDLNNIHRAFTVYDKQMVRESREEPLIFLYLKAVEIARKYLIAETRNITNDVVKGYENDLPQKTIEDIRSTIRAKSRSYYRRLTGEGPISRGIGLDAENPDNWEDLDNTNGRKNLFRMSRNYEDALGFDMLLKHFEERRKNKMDFRNGNFKLYYIEGLEQQPRIVATPYSL